ncbi:MAG: XRE family transcriptional regulator [Firmicutes bacterium]|nr:XRE family transcriptional regulator [Bacillota bacterium]
MEKELGRQIKQLRLEQGLTMKELGKRANLSTGYISLLERGLSSISLTSLQKITEALGANRNYFFQMPPSPARKVVRGYDLTVFKLKGSHYIYHSLIGDVPEKERQMEPTLVTLLPGMERNDILPFAHEGEEFGFVLEGVLTFIIEDKNYDLNPGDSLHIPSTLPHNWANLTNKLVKLLYVNTAKVFL